MPKNGIDIAHPYQHVNSFDRVKKAGIDICVVKCTERINYENPKYFSWMNDAKNSGLDIGSYHFYNPNDDPVIQAQFYVKTAGYRTDWRTPVLDAEILNPEHSQAQNQDHISEYLEEIADELGILADLYTGSGFWKSIGNPTIFSNHKLWIASYTDNLSLVKTQALEMGWTSIKGWQHTSGAYIDGIVGSVDLSYWEE